MKRRVTKKVIHAKEYLNDPREYNKSFPRGLRISLGDCTLIVLSGTASIDEKGRTYRPGNFSAQVKRTYDNITALLKSAGSDWHDVIKTVCYLKNMKYYEEFNRYRNRFYKKLKLDPFPASVGIEAGLCRPDLLIEIEVTAIIKSS